MSIQRAVATFAVALGLSAFVQSPAEAFGDRAPSGWGERRDVHHHVYHPHYRHIYHYHPYTDPYAYRYEPRGYYPYYASHYWVPARVLRERKAYRLAHRHHGPRFKYYQAWGYPKKHWDHKKWHDEHHGRHRHGHW